jgi:hypothetical protein
MFEGFERAGEGCREIFEGCNPNCFLIIVIFQKKKSFVIFPTVKRFPPSGRVVDDTSESVALL